MFSFGKTVPFEEDIEKATSENNTTEDWSLIMHICDSIVNYQDGARFCLKAIVKRLYHDVPHVVLQTLTLLDACVKNCDKKFLLQVASSEFTNEIQKLLKKMHPQVAVKLKELLQKWALEDFKDDSELCIIPSLYYKLKSEGIEFPSPIKEKKPAPQLCTDPDAVSSQEEENDIIKAIEISLKDTGKHMYPSEINTAGWASDQDFKSLPEPLKVRALYDFDAAEENELTIKAGEILLVLDNGNASWWKGSNHRGEGLFPSNFVTEDLDAKPEESSEVTDSTTEAAPVTTFSGEVELNEQKIETVLNWLNETDPTGDEPDPPEMLRLEDEVLKMGSLIEANLHSIDKKMAMLNMVNEKIVTAFDLFHSYSDQPSPNIPPLKYLANSYLPGQMIPPQVSSASMHPNMAHLPAQQVVYVPVPAMGSHPNPIHTDIPKITASQTNLPVITSNATSSAAIVTSATQNSETNNSSSDTSGQKPVGMNPYTAPMGGYYLPQGMQLPMQYYPPDVQIPGGPTQPFSPGPSYVANFPYAVPPMGPYFQLPYYHMNSASGFQANNPVPQAENKGPDNNQAQLPSSNVETSAMPTISTQPVYSSDLQSLAFSNSQQAHMAGQPEQSASNTNSDVHQS